MEFVHTPWGVSDSIYRNYSHRYIHVGDSIDVVDHLPVEPDGREDGRIEDGHRYVVYRYNGPMLNHNAGEVSFEGRRSLCVDVYFENGKVSFMKYLRPGM
jgi:hypothetical protein